MSEHMAPPTLPIPLLVIAGPTGVGKTEAALSVAQAVGGEIVSADSMQLYQGMDIGTAKPTPTQQQQTTFHLIDIVDPDEEYNVARFQHDARAVIQSIHARQRLPILCGGTGLYIQAVLEHYDFPPDPGDKQIRRRLQQQASEIGTQQMHQRLAQVDSTAAARIAPTDLKRIVRALEVYELTGQTLSAQQSVDEAPAVKYNQTSYVLSCPRSLLYQRIEQRVDEMMARGWLGEVQRLRTAGYSSKLQAMQAIGYRHLLAYLDGSGDLQETVQVIKRDSRRFAKRQLTWFRNRADFTWLTWSTQPERRQITGQLIEAGRELVADLR